MKIEMRIIKVPSISMEPPIRHRDCRDILKKIVMLMELKMPKNREDRRATMVIVLVLWLSGSVKEATSQPPVIPLPPPMGWPSPVGGWRVRVGVVVGLT